METVRTRTEVPAHDTWAVEELYNAWSSWEKDLALWAREGKAAPRYPEIAALRGRLHEGIKTILELLNQYFHIDRQLSKLYTFAHLKHDEDLGEEAGKRAYHRIHTACIDFREETSWIEPELLSLPDEVLKSLLAAKELALYHTYLARLRRMKLHTLSSSEERLMALAEKPLSTASHTFSLFNNADLKFQDVEDQKGEKLQLTHGRYLRYLRSEDRTLRKSTFLSLHEGYAAFENSCCELLQGEVQRHVFYARARGFKSCLEAALYPLEIDTAVYTTLTETVQRHLPRLHAYVQLRKDLLGLDEVHLYDLSAPLIPEPPKRWEYRESVATIVASVAPLGKAYQKDLEGGLTTKRWVDIYENQRKRSGAYSSGCYDSMPYILMNYQGTFNDLETLSHEAGHSMHSLKTHGAQPYIYATTPIFVAEVASTFHEILLLRHLIQHAKTPNEKAFLICQEIDLIRATLFRQTQFAEFELEIHKWVEEGTPLTPSLLKQRYTELNQAYYGPALVLDDVAAIEWARIPHFYYNFYVYQYATGLSAAFHLASRVLAQEPNQEPDAVERYLGFLSSGSSRDPLATLQAAGVDMRTPQPVETLMGRFSELVQELSTILMKDVASK